MTDKEQKIFDSVGGGEKGEAAVAAYREYIRDYNEMERQHAKDNRCRRFQYKNEKSSATLPMVEDDYEE